MIILIILAVLSAIPAADAQEITISMFSGQQTQPDIFGDHIVWADNRYGNWDIFIYDITQSSEDPVVLHTANQDQPKVHGNHIVWRDDRNGNYDIYLYDIFLGRETQVTYDPADSTSPSIYGSWIVWEDNRFGNWDIFAYNIDSGIETQLTVEDSDQRYPVLFGDTIAYLDNTDGDYEIYAGSLPMIFDPIADIPDYPDSDMDFPSDYTPGAADIQQITFDHVDQDPPYVWSTTVIWSDARDFNKDVFMYDLTTRTETRLTYNPSDQYDPKLYGSTVIWVDDRNANSDIYRYDLISNVQERVTYLESNEYDTAIFNNRMVWVSDASGEGDLFMLTFDLAVWEPPDSIAQVDPKEKDIDQTRSYRYPIAAVAITAVIAALYFKKRVSGNKDDLPENLPSLKDINKLKKKDELIKKCKELGLNPYGNKKRLRARLITFVKVKERERREAAVREAEALAKKTGKRKELEKKPRTLEIKDDLIVPKNLDYDSVTLEWDDGLESSGIIGENEKIYLDYIGI